MRFFNVDLIRKTAEVSWYYKNILNNGFGTKKCKVIKKDTDYVGVVVAPKLEGNWTIQRVEIKTNTDCKFVLFDYSVSKGPIFYEDDNTGEFQPVDEKNCIDEYSDLEEFPTDMRNYFSKITHYTDGKNLKVKAKNTDSTIVETTVELGSNSTESSEPRLVFQSTTSKGLTTNYTYLVQSLENDKVLLRFDVESNC